MFEKRATDVACVGGRNRLCQLFLTHPVNLHRFTRLWNSGEMTDDLHILTRLKAGVGVASGTTASATIQIKESWHMKFIPGWRY